MNSEVSSFPHIPVKSHPCVSVEFIENSYRTSFSSLGIPSYIQNSKQCNNVMQLLNVDCCASYIREVEFVPLLSVMYG